MRYALLLVTATVFSLALTPAMRELARRVGAMDVPSARKLHGVPVPRLGGLALALAAALTIAAGVAVDAAVGTGPGLDMRAWAPLLVGGACVLAVGIRDDLRGVSPLTKLAFQGGAAGAAISLGVDVERVTVLGVTHELGLLRIPITLAWIVVVTNAFNLMDGLDGLATGLAIIAAATCGLLLIARGDAQGAMALAVLLGALCGFLPYNVSPARIYLGDSGSLLVGYVLGVTAITGMQKGATSLAVTVPLLVFALPLAETVSSATRRLLERPPRSERPLVALAHRLRRVVDADRAHVHHRLIDLGLSTRSVVLLLYGVSVFLSLIALTTARVP